MKKTLLVTLDFYPNLGGVAGYWESLSREMPAREWVVLAPLLPHGVQELRAPYTIYRRWLLSQWVNPHWFPLFFHILSIVQKEKIEYIIVGQVLPIGTVVRALSFFLKIPYAVSCHGMDIVLPQRSWHKRRLCSSIFKNAAKIIANSRFTAGQLARFGVSQESATIVYPCPVITPELLNGAPSDEQSQPIILTVARLQERKGHETVLRGVQSLLKKYPSLTYGIG